MFDFNLIDFAFIIYYNLKLKFQVFILKLIFKFKFIVQLTFNRN